MLLYSGLNQVATTRTFLNFIVSRLATIIIYGVGGSDIVIASVYDVSTQITLFPVTSGIEFV